MNTPVSFPLAKLLKEKGFDEPCPNLYYEPERCKKPTISDVVMWRRLKLSRKSFT